MSTIIYLNINQLESETQLGLSQATGAEKRITLWCYRLHFKVTHISSPFLRSLSSFLLFLSEAHDSKKWAIEEGKEASALCARKVLK